MAGGSEGKQKEQVHTLLLKFFLNRRHGFLQQLGEHRDRAHHRDGSRRQTADDSFGFEIDKPFSRKRNIQIFERPDSDRSLMRDGEFRVRNGTINEA